MISNFDIVGADNYDDKSMVMIIEMWPSQLSDILL